MNSCVEGIGDQVRELMSGNTVVLAWCVHHGRGGHTNRPALQPITVGGPFHRVRVDVLQLPLTLDNNQYAVVFIDYLTKWVEVFAVLDQKAETIARLFVEGVVCRHGAPGELLSDRGTNFLSNLVLEVCKLFDVKKLNTSGYHPQTNGWCERFNSTLIQMLVNGMDMIGISISHMSCMLTGYRGSLHSFCCMVTIPCCLRQTLSRMSAPPIWSTWTITNSILQRDWRMRGS